MVQIVKTFSVPDSMYILCNDTKSRVPTPLHVHAYTQNHAQCTSVLMYSKNELVIIHTHTHTHTQSDKLLQFFTLYWSRNYSDSFYGKTDNEASYVATYMQHSPSELHRVSFLPRMEKNDFHVVARTAYYF